jgi:hypothetical protein
MGGGYTTTMNITGPGFEPVTCGTRSGVITTTPKLAVLIVLSLVWRKRVLAVFPPNKAAK